MALRGSANAQDVGGAQDICYATYLLIGGARQAEIDLRLLRSTLPKVPSLVQKYLTKTGKFLPSSLAQGGGDIGPSSPRGRAWRKIALASPAYRRGQVLDGARAMPMLLQSQTEADPAFIPDYDQSPPCTVNHKPMPKVQINNAIPPAEMDEDLYEFCAATFAEIMSGFAQTGEMVITMLGDWCSWQSSVSDWVGRHDELGHPDWDFRRCQGMQDLVSFALRNDMKTGLGPKDVCARVFLSMGDIEWMASAIDNAWVGPALRESPALALTNAGNSEAAKKLMEDAAAYADALFSKLRDQKDMYSNLNDVKMDSSAFSAVHRNRHPKLRAQPIPKLPTFNELS